MKQLKCLACGKEWYVDDLELNFVMTCPFCSTMIRHKDSIGEINTLGKAIYKAISDQGLDMLANVGKVSGYLLDIVPDLKKEIRIFNKTFDHEYITLLRTAFEKESNDIVLILSKLKRLFMEEEGLSESWADMLCENCQMAILYYKGQGLQDILSAEIVDIDFDKSITGKKQTMVIEPLSHSLNMKSVVGVKVGDSMRFGKHENGDPIMWRILAMDDDIALLHYTGSDLEQCFHDKKNMDITWKDCQLRAWLNRDFIVKHFTDKEEKFLIQANIETAGVITQDKLFCLSIDEAKKYKDLMKGMYKPWLLRDEGTKRGFIATYEHEGPYLWGVHTNYKTGIRPAMYISTSYFSN